MVSSFDAIAVVQTAAKPCEKAVFDIYTWE
jgi:hypothetical protein